MGKLFYFILEKLLEFPTTEIILIVFAVVVAILGGMI